MFLQSCCKICKKAYSSRNSISFFVKSVVEKVITRATPGRSLVKHIVCIFGPVLVLISALLPFDSGEYIMGGKLISCPIHYDLLLSIFSVHLVRCVDGDRREADSGQPFGILFPHQIRRNRAGQKRRIGGTTGSSSTVEPRFKRKNPSPQLCLLNKGFS